MALVITTCTNNKFAAVSETLRAASLPKADLGDVARAWGNRIKDARPRYSAQELYAGRGFRESRLAAERLNAPLYIVSAGVGLIAATTEVPAYACTVVAGSPDDILARISTKVALPDWWTALTLSSPFSADFGEVTAQSSGPILAALSDTYLAMVGDHLLALAQSDVDRLRIFTRAQPSRLPSRLRPAWMPYDDRLEGKDSGRAGARGSFAARAMRHFVDHVLVADDQRDAEAHADAVRDALEGWRFPKKVARIRHDDVTMRRLIAEHWSADQRFGPTLRYFRDALLVACEQTRFKDLKKEVERARL